MNYLYSKLNKEVRPHRLIGMTTDTASVYTDPTYEGIQISVNVLGSSEAVASMVVQYDEEGRIKVSNPIESKHSANKGYVDDLIEHLYWLLVNGFDEAGNQLIVKRAAEDSEGNKIVETYARSLDECILLDSGTVEDIVNGMSKE